MTVFALFFLAFLASPSTADAATAVPDTPPVRVSIEHEILAIREHDDHRIGEVVPSATDLIERIYEARDYRPLWQDGRSAALMIETIEASWRHGLLAEDFHYTPILERWQALKQAPGPRGFADLDLLLTDALVRYGSQLIHGKVSPKALDADWNFDRPMLATEPAHLIGEVLDDNRLPELLKRLPPDHDAYRSLQAALIDYRGHADDGGWKAMPADTPVLKPGDRHQTVPALRERLVAEGFIVPAVLEPEHFDPALVDAVRHFQARQGLETDGIVGQQTVAALNVPVEIRIDQIRVNLERARWVLRGLDDDFVAVNIAGFKTYLVRDGNVVFRTRSVVGRPYRKTPVFRDEITFMEFNPTWTVPPTILYKDVIPAIRNDAAYLQSQRMTILDNANQPVDPMTLNWDRVVDQGFPYRIVQAPGPNNALGLVKFMFPNRHLVYLHDSPAKSLFSKSARSFSSGCVRLEQPFELAELLMEADPTWNRARIDALIESGRTTRVDLPEPMPVLLLYWTVESNDGAVSFHPDIYDRDAAILRALDAPMDAA